ncbi:MAG: hypothetical protein J5956_04365 [Ruminococcus sp.]|nr:hypothetical protein [Ruminococcus sp.]
MTIKKRLVAVAAATMLAVSVFPLSAFADKGAEYEKREVTAYKYSMDKSEKMQCLFLNDLPDVPYVDVEAYLDSIYTKDFTTSADGDVYTVSGNGMTIVADTAKETLTINGFDSNFQLNILELEKKEDNPEYVTEPEASIDGTEKPVSIDYSKYKIDLIGDDGKLYLPLTSISNIFDCVYRLAEYINGNLYFTSVMSRSGTGSGYYDRSPIYLKKERSQAMIDYTYNELCVYMDYFFGKPSNAIISKAIAEKGFDKALDDDYPEIKQLLLSKSRADFHLGTLLLDDATDDGGHTAMYYGIFGDLQIFPEDQKDNLIGEYIVRIQESLKAQEQIAKMKTPDNTRDRVQAAREEKLKNATKVKEWPEDGVALYVNGKTALFQFAGFIHPVVDDFVWSLDYASKNGVKNFVIDVAANGGGEEKIVHFINAMMANKQKNNNAVVTKMHSAPTGNTINTKYVLDLDHNGTIDDKDKSVYYDFNYAILTSKSSFSSANMLPCLAKDNGILILGETSGGGTCMGSQHCYADSVYFAAAGLYTMNRKDGTDLDAGAAVDFDLTAKNADGTTSYLGFYDFAKLEECIDKFYGVTQEAAPEETPQQAKVEPAKAVVDKDAAPPTGHVGDTITAAVLLIAVGSLAVKRKDMD